MSQRNENINGYLHFLIVKMANVDVVRSNRWKIEEKIKKEP